MSGASERANGRASGLVIQSVFLAVFVHSAMGKAQKKRLTVFVEGKAEKV